MAGSRVQKFGTVFSRMQGLFRSNAVSFEDRPLWYDVWEAFPPAVEPKYLRAEPSGEVRKILYPEDNVRAYFFKNYHLPDLTNMKSNKKTLAQKFVEMYIENQRPGITEDQLLKEVQDIARKEGIRYLSRTESLVAEEEKSTLNKEKETNRASSKIDILDL